MPLQVPIFTHLKIMPQLILRIGPITIAGVVETNWLTPHKVRQLDQRLELRALLIWIIINQTVQLHDNQWIRKAKIEQSEPLKNELAYFNRLYCGWQKPKPMWRRPENMHLKSQMAAIKSYGGRKIN